MHIIGGGVVGLCSAWYLQHAGYQVTVIDKSDMQNGCSFGNAGIIVPSHFVPLASPGVITQGIRWMFKQRSPFFIRPRMDPDLLRWLWRFYRSCNSSHVARTISVLKDFHLLSKSQYLDFNGREEFDFDFSNHGSLMLYNSNKGRHEEHENAEKALALGLQVTELSQQDVSRIQKGVRCDVLGGLLYHDDAHFYPDKFILQLQSELKDLGVIFKTGMSVTGFKTHHDKITHLSMGDGESTPVKEVVLACGAWSGKLAKTLGLRILMQDGKGYSMTFRNYTPQHYLPSILTEARVAVTPMGSDLRVGGTLEVSNFSSVRRLARVAGILDAMYQYYPDFPELGPGDVDIWQGFRPVTADGLPYIGRPQKYSNLIIAAGHAMLGMSLGPATGLCVSEIARGVPTSLPMDLFNVDRHR
jgi:D-amino-acid dehydrogenase